MAPLHISVITLNKPVEIVRLTGVLISICSDNPLIITISLNPTVKTYGLYPGFSSVKRRKSSESDSRLLRSDMKWCLKSSGIVNISSSRIGNKVNLTLNLSDPPLIFHNINIPYYPLFSTYFALSFI